jgi:hypothetical protein
MTHEQREQAAEVLEKFQKGIYGYGGKVGVAIDTAIAALRGPQPDPITGLVPCGCGGKAILEKGINYHSGYYVICEKCECNIGLDRDDFLRPFGAYPTAEQAVSDWNRAIGWKGGAE